MNKRGRSPIGLQRWLQTIGPELISNILNQVKGNGGSGREGRRIGTNRHTRGRSCSCQLFVREGVKEKGGNPLLVIDTEVANTRED